MTRSVVRSLAQQRSRRALLTLLPLLTVLALVAGWPLARTIGYSFTDAELQTLSSWRFVGLDNYLGDFGLLASAEWWQSVRNTLVFTALSVAIETALGLAVALLLNQPSRWRTLLRVALLVPWAIPTVVSARIWSWMLHDPAGIINQGLLGVGLIAAPLAFTADPQWSMATLVLVDVWKATPYMALLILAGLQMVPTDCIEAARVDGVPAWAVFRHITLPLILPAIAVAAIFRTLDALRVFDLIYVMTANSSETRSMSVYVREQLVGFGLVGYGSAAATVLFFVVALVTVAAMVLMRRNLQAASA